jgi:hypothetical protein
MFVLIIGKLIMEHENRKQSIIQSLTNESRHFVVTKEFIGSGTFGNVYIGKDNRSGNLVAIKSLKDPNVVNAMQTEAIMLATLSEHHGIVKCLGINIYTVIIYINLISAIISNIFIY